MIPSPAQLLETEERQLHYFLTAVRPVGEEKSELYPEPQYFNTSFISVGALLPRILDLIDARAGGAAGYAARCRRVLSPATALHLSGLAFIATWGREMWLLEEPGADPESGLIAPGTDATLSDREAARVLRFAHDAVSNYRCDGRTYPRDDGALGADYRILPDADARAIAAGLSSVDAAQAATVLRLLATVRALSFLMEGETREALMMHGPYPAGEDGARLVVFECSDLHWALFPRFPLPGGVRWELPPQPFPWANLAIALLVRDTDITADRFGTLYLDPLAPGNILAAGLLTRGRDALVDEGLSVIPLSEAGPLARLCDDIQEFLFLQIAGWDLRQRMAAGVHQEHMLLLRMLSAAGHSREEVIAQHDRILHDSQPIIDRYFESCLARPVEKLPYYAKLGAFAAGQSPTLFTPLRFAGASAGDNA